MPNAEAGPPLGLLEYLDLSVGRSVTARQQLGFRSALLADRLGYRRIWVPEHHGTGSPSTNPLPLVAVLGSHTRRIRVGPAVSLVRIRDPYLTAEDLATAGAFCGDRLDVGLGRGAVGGPGTEVWDYLRKDDAATDRAISTIISVLDAGCEWIDPLGTAYQRWMHGAGGRSAELAGSLGFSYCHGLFLNPDEGTCLRTLESYRVAFSTGHTAVAVAVVANPDAAIARADAARQRGLQVACAGTAEQCANAMWRLQELTGVDEVVLAELSHDPEDHLRAVTAVFEQFALSVPHLEPLDTGRKVGS